jgi:hypothetical protein
LKEKYEQNPERRRHSRVLASWLIKHRWNPARIRKLNTIEIKSDLPTFAGDVRNQLS